MKSSYNNKTNAELSWLRVYDTIHHVPRKFIRCVEHMFASL